MVGNSKIKFRSVLSVLLLGVIVSGCASYGSNTYSIITPEVKSASSDNNNVRVTVSSNAWNSSSGSNLRFCFCFFGFRVALDDAHIEKYIQLGGRISHG